MKKIFTLALALMGFAGASNAATVDDIVVCKHSYVFKCEDYASGSRAKGVLFGDNHFLDVTGGSTGTKGCFPLTVVDEEKYADYATTPTKSLRLKNAQDVIAMKITAGSKLIIVGEKHKSRGPKINTAANMDDKTTLAKSENTAETEGIFTWTADDDRLIYIGSQGGDYYISWIVVEAKEAPGTPTVKVGPQTYEGGLWFREVTCIANPATEEGSDEKIPTVVTYTTDGTAPTAASPVYKESIKCYKDMTVKFQAFLDLGDGQPAEDLICDGADNEGNVNFSFNAPAISAEGANVTITSEYDGAKNFYKLNGADATEGSSFTLAESATVEAYSQIVNGDYTTFTTKSTTKDVYVLNPIKEKKIITVTAADVVIDDEATASSKDGSNVYKVENGAISADKKDFFVKNLTFGVLKDAKAQYQVPEGQEAYIQMSNTNIVFKVAAGDKVKVKVTCTKNSCKNIDAEDAAEDKLDNGCTPDRQCYVNVSGTNYCLTDAEGKHTNDLKLYPDANVFEFELEGGKNVTSKDEEGNDVTTFEAKDTYYTFLKYSGTGNILISSIEITPVESSTGIAAISNVEEKAKDAIFNLAGQQVDKTFKGVVIKNGKKMIQK